MLYSEMAHCKPGQTPRKKHTRKYKSGTKGSVKASCVKTKPRSTIGPLKRGSLTQFGYKTINGDASRHTALTKAVKKLGCSSIVKKLNAIFVMTKKTKPHFSKIYEADLEWVQANYRC